MLLAPVVVSVTVWPVAIVLPAFSVTVTVCPLPPAPPDPPIAKFSAAIAPAVLDTEVPPLPPPPPTLCAKTPCAQSPLVVTLPELVTLTSPPSPAAPPLPPRETVKPNFSGMFFSTMAEMNSRVPIAALTGLSAEASAPADPDRPPPPPTLCTNTPVESPPDVSTLPWTIADAEPPLPPLPPVPPQLKVPVKVGWTVAGPQGGQPTEPPRLTEPPWLVPPPPPMLCTTMAGAPEP